MARYKCIGVAQKTGEYQGQKYDNIVIFCTFEADGMIAGQSCKQFKVKTRNLSDCFEGCKTAKPIKSPSDVAQIVGCDLKIYCDTYGNPEEIFLLNK